MLNSFQPSQVEKTSLDISNPNDLSTCKICSFDPGSGAQKAKALIGAALLCPRQRLTHAADVHGLLSINTQGISSTYNILLLGIYAHGLPHKTECQQGLEKKIWKLSSPARLFSAHKARPDNLPFPHSPQMVLWGSHRWPAGIFFKNFKLQIKMIQQYS